MYTAQGNYFGSRSATLICGVSVDVSAVSCAVKFGVILSAAFGERRVKLFSEFAWKRKTEIKNDNIIIMSVLLNEVVINIVIANKTINNIIVLFRKHLLFTAIHIVEMIDLCDYTMWRKLLYLTQKHLFSVNIPLHLHFQEEITTDELFSLISFI